MKFAILISFLIPLSASAFVIRENYTEVDCKASFDEQYRYASLDILVRGKSVAGQTYGNSVRDQNAIEALCVSVLDAARNANSSGSNVTQYVLIRTDGSIENGNLITNEVAGNSCRN